MGLFDDYFDPAQFQASGGLLGRFLSLRPDLDPSQPGADDANQQDAPDTQVTSQALSPAASQAPIPVSGGHLSSLVLMPTSGSAQKPAASGDFRSPQSPNAVASDATSPPLAPSDRVSAGPELPMTEVGYVEIPAASNPVLG